MLRSVLDGSAVNLDVMPDDARPQLAQASRLAESLRLSDSTYHADLGWWTAPFVASEGISYSDLASAAERDRVDIGRAFPVAHHRERHTQIPKDASTILVLSTDDDSRATALASGEALSAILLECAMVGSATCPVTHVTEVAVSRELVGALVGHGPTPQILVRVGLAAAMDGPPPPTPRRPLDDVLSLQPRADVLVAAKLDAK